jgi:hypothetical protein
MWERKSEVVLFKQRRNGDDQAYGSIGWTAYWEWSAMLAVSKWGMVPWRHMRNKDVLVCKSSSWLCSPLHHLSNASATSIR